MQIDYKRDLNHNYMIIREEGEPDAASYQIRMLQANSISGILECRIHKMDNCTLFYYDVTSRQALQTLYDHQQVGASLLRMLFHQLVKVLEELGSYLLEPEGIVLTPNTIYLTAEPLEFSFCYLPGEKCSVNEQMRDLMEYFLPRLNHQEPETVVLGYGLYKALSDSECSLEQLKSLLSREIEVPVQQEPFAEQKREAKEEQEEMRQKAMEAFFEEDEEEEKEGVFWTAAIIVGGVAILALVVYLMYAVGVPAFMYLLLLGTAGISIIAVFLWLKRKEQAEEREADKERKTVRKDAEMPGPAEIEDINEEDEELEGKIRSGAGNANGIEGFPDFHAKHIREDGFRSSKAQPGTKLLNEKKSKAYGGQAEQYQRQSGSYKSQGGLYRSQNELYRSPNQLSGSQTEPYQTGIMSNAASSTAENMAEERKLASRLLYQKTEPLFIRAPRKENFRLVPVSHAEVPEIVITKEETLIGKLGTAVDAVIPFPTVSRLHAKLHCAQGICLLTDLNSCNGTYVNEVQLEGDIPRKLEDGDEVAFANIKYQFHG